MKNNEHINVTEIRNRFGVSQARFAEAVGVDQATVSNWEKGKNEPRGPARRVLLGLTEADFADPEQAGVA